MWFSLNAPEILFANPSCIGVCSSLFAPPWQLMLQLSLALQDMHLWTKFKGRLVGFAPFMDNKMLDIHHICVMHSSGFYPHTFLCFPERAKGELPITEDHQEGSGHRPRARSMASTLASLRSLVLVSCHAQHALNPFLGQDFKSGPSTPTPLLVQKTLLWFWIQLQFLKTVSVCVEQRRFWMCLLYYIHSPPRNISTALVNIKKLACLKKITIFLYLEIDTLSNKCIGEKSGRIYCININNDTSECWN